MEILSEDPFQGVHLTGEREPPHKSIKRES